MVTGSRRGLARTRRCLASRALGLARDLSFVGLLLPVRLALDAHHLGAMHQPVDQRDDAGRIGEHLAPFGEGLVRGHHRALVLVAPTDQLEQQVGMPVRVRQVADLVDHEQVRRRVVFEPPAQGRVAVQRGQLAQQLRRRDEQGCAPGQHRLVAQVARAHRLAHAIGSDQHDVAGVLEERQRHQLLDDGAIALRGPCPVEVGQGLEGSDVCGAQPPLQTSAVPLSRFPAQQLGDPARLLGVAHQLGPAAEQAMQAQLAGLLAQALFVYLRVGQRRHINCRHRRSPFGRRKPGRVRVPARRAEQRARAAPAPPAAVSLLLRAQVPTPGVPRWGAARRAAAPR